MPDLRQLLADEAVRRRPAQSPSFTAVEARARRRTRGRVLGAALGLAALTTTCALMISSVTASEVVAPAGTVRYAADGFAFSYPATWLRGLLADSTPAGATPLVWVGTSAAGAPCEAGPDAQVNCAQPPVQMRGSGVYLQWTRHDPAPGQPGLDVVRGRPITVDGRPAWLTRDDARSGCRTMGGSTELGARVDLDGAAWLSMTACLADPTGVTEQQVLDLLSSVTIVD